MKLFKNLLAGNQIQEVDKDQWIFISEINLGNLFFFYSREFITVTVELTRLIYQSA